MRILGPLLVLFLFAPLSADEPKARRGLAYADTKNEEAKRAAICRIKFADEKMRKELSSVTHVAKGKNIQPFLILHVADHPETKAQSQRLVKVLQGAGISAKAYPAEGKNHTTSIMTWG